MEEIILRIHQNKNIERKRRAKPRTQAWPTVIVSHQKEIRVENEMG